jgi:hypothetical protein
MVQDTRWEDIDALLERAERTKTEELVKAAQAIAAERFTFPTEEHPSYRGYVNLPEHTMEVQVGNELIAPDIVVVERLKTGETHLVMTAAVATVEMVTEAEAKQEWARLAAIPNSIFYLYTPIGHGAQAKKLCSKLKIKGVFHRTWRWTPRGFEINDITEPMSGLAPLMPPIIRNALRTP